VSIRLSEKINTVTNSQTFLVSVPFIASILLLGGTFLTQHFFSFTLTFDPFIERVFISVFLFSIGFQMANMYKKIHVKRLFILLGMSIPM
jgi:hypothetical protein